MLESKPSPRTQDGHRTDSESFTESEDRQRSATIATAFLRDPSGRFIDRELQSVSASHKAPTLSGQSLPVFASGGFLSLELFESVSKRRPPGLRIGPQGLGKAHQRREFCPELQLILTPGQRPSDMVVQSVELTTQLYVLHPSPSWIVIIRRGRMVVQRPVDRRSRATDRGPQPGDFRANVGLSVNQQSRIVSRHRPRVKVRSPQSDATTDGTAAPGRPAQKTDVAPARPR
jgi:hypothetical protein